MRRLAEGASRSGSDFRAVAKAFLAQPGLLFLSLLSAERIERVFAKQDNLFGQGTIYSTAIMVWSFLGQVPRAKRPWRGSSCIRRRWVVVHQTEVGGEVPTADTGDYFAARGPSSARSRCTN